MDNLKLYIIWLCFVLSAAELLGPEAQKKDKDDENSVENVKEESSNDPEYFNEFSEALNNEFKQMKDLREYAEALSKAAEFLKGDVGDKELDPAQVESGLEQVDHTLKLLKKTFFRHDPNWLQDAKGVGTHENELGNSAENPQDILDALPPLPEQEEPMLSPELQTAKDIYEDAVDKLERRTPDLRGTILSIKEAADTGYVPAKIKLAWSYIYGEGVELDVQKAKDIFEKLAAEGNADAHGGMGFLYANGIAVPVSQAKALVHYTMGALGQSDYAQMALAYRHWAGVTVPSSCPKALELYMKVASKVASQVSLSGGPAVHRVRLMDELDGVSTGSALDTDLIEYYQLLAEKGDVQAQIGLGQLHFQGGRGVTLDQSKALHYFKQAAKSGNAVANAFLGKIYLEGGDGIKADNATALEYFKKAAELNNPVGQSGMGLMYLQGRGVAKDSAKAYKYFTVAANQGWVEGQLHLGFMYFSGIGVKRDFKKANKYFSLASQSGHVLALYHLAQMHAQGLGVMRSCPTAAELFKNVCERGRWGSRLMLAHRAYKARDSDSAFLQYLSLAERGYEVAQSNAAFLLDDGETRLFSEPESWARALQLWSRAAAQGCAGARVKLGDYHYYGLGTPQDLDTAAHHYRVASEQLHNAQATFNLGYMHERGLGLSRDLHLAKRCYDLAADASPDARLPAALALARLHAHSAIENMLESPLAVIFLTGESTLLSNWDVYLITVLVGALGIVVYLRRPPQPAN
ncbi:protein sel-1 homolog 1 isoform X2 [Pararge aegeria]|uniref:protein sel-1 homolog 1 isoform X2 n=1 Tax=Pararge aegeria TaxID=116150 RepID=UPI0019D21164|nr:protein sel-1 homolog 1 isoform X2 [Pararge aegeria]